jgi:hypothetical protein
MISRKAIFWTAGGATAVLIAAAVAAGPVMSEVEQPDYKVDKHDGAIQIRWYPPMIAAETTVHGERKPAINKGFRRIAGYIFGDNKPREKIAMTAPVEQQRQKIAMTAPVTEQGEGDTWTVRFIMPKSWTMQTLPVPSDPSVTLNPIPARRYVVITFSGFAGAETIKNKTDELRQYAEEHHLTTIGEPILAFYNPPWTLPFFRRNEIMFELGPERASSTRPGPDLT